MTRTMGRVGLLLAVLGVGTAVAQNPLWKQPGGWRPWRFTVLDVARQKTAASPAEVQGFQARVEELAAIVRRTPVLSPPIGFAVLLVGNLDVPQPRTGGVPDAQLPLPGSLTFGAFDLARNVPPGKPNLGYGETALLHLQINKIDYRYLGESLPIEWSGEEVDGFVQARVGPVDAHGLTRIGDVFLMVSSRNRGRPLWLPFTLQEAMAPVLAQRRRLLRTAQENLARQQREFTDWLSPQQRAARQADWQKTVALLPAAERSGFLANMRQSEAAIENDTRERLAPGGSEERGVREAEQELRAAEAALAGAGAAGQRLQACYDDKGTTIAARFRVLAGAPAHCRPLVKTNWQFFDPARPRTAPQVVLIAEFARCLTPEKLASGTSNQPGNCVTNRQLVDTLDWTAVQAWLDR